jgi:putative spermidine/putrescine transport system ATP-binding protein
VTHDQEEALSLSDRVVVMSEGRIEQIGAPADIYNFPATRFVASFVGTLNLLEARVVDASAGRIAVAGQEIRAARPVDAGNGSPVTVAIRPEGIELGANGGANQLTGRVEDVSFLGSIVRTRLNLDGNGTTLSLDTFNDPSLHAAAIDSTVTVSFPPEACLVLASSAAAPSPTDAVAAAEAML